MANTFIDDDGNLWLSETIGKHTTNTLIGKVDDKPKKVRKTKKSKENGK